MGLNCKPKINQNSSCRRKSVQHKLSLRPQTHRILWFVFHWLTWTIVGFFWRCIGPPEGTSGALLFRCWVFNAQRDKFSLWRKWNLNYTKSKRINRHWTETRKMLVDKKQICNLNCNEFGLRWYRDTQRWHVCPQMVKLRRGFNASNYWSMSGWRWHRWNGIFMSFGSNGGLGLR